jgi:predicted nucleic acid-binding protein
MKEYNFISKTSLGPTPLTSAMEAKADFIVSRDPHLRNLKQFQGVKIIGVKGFTEKVRKG